MGVVVVMMVGMSMFSSPIGRRREPRPTPQPVAPTGSNRFEDLLRGVGAARFNTGKALLGTALGALDVPVQAIGGMHRDVVQGAPTGGQSAGSRAVQNYGQQVGGLVSDVFRPGVGQTPLFQPREFDAAGEAAVGRFGLEGAGASAVRGGATALDLLTGVAAGGVGGVGRGAATNIPLAAPYLRQAAYVSDSPVVRDTLMGRHFGPTNLSVIHPRNVPIVDARTAGPGTYFTNTDSAAHSLRLRLPGDRSGEYSAPLSFMDRYKLANSRGYAGPDDVMESVKNLGLEGNFPDVTHGYQGGIPLSGAEFDNPIVENLLRKGFVGFEGGKGYGFPTGEFTNWLVGADDIARINPRLPQLGLQSGPADVNSIPRIESILRRIFPSNNTPR